MSKKHEKRLLLIYNYLQPLLRRFEKKYYGIWYAFTEFGGKFLPSLAKIPPTDEHGRARMCTETRYINPNMSIHQRTLSFGEPNMHNDMLQTTGVSNGEGVD